MSEVTDAVAPEPAAPLPGLIARAIGVLVSPRATFERLAPTPKVGGMLLLVAVLISASAAPFLMTEHGQQAWLDATIQVTEHRSGQPITPQQQAGVEKIAPYMGYVIAGGALAVTPIFILFEAGVLYLIFTFGTGGTATFKQVMAVVTHTGVISVLLMVFTTAMQFVQGTYSTSGVSPANLGALVPMLPEESWLAHFLGLIDLFRVWSIITLSIGLSVIYHKKTRNIALTLFVIYGVVIAAVAYFFR